MQIDLTPKQHATLSLLLTQCGAELAAGNLREVDRALDEAGIDLALELCNLRLKVG